MLEKNYFFGKKKLGSSYFMLKMLGQRSHSDELKDDGQELF
jgi:hypothetical protein